MARVRVHSDDDVRRIRHVWVGVKGYTWPFTATYQAWGLWAGLVAAALLVEWVTPLTVSPFPFWEAVFACIVTTAVADKLDHDKPLRMLPAVIWQNTTAPRHDATVVRHRPAPGRVRVRSRETR